MRNMLKQVAIIMLIVILATGTTYANSDGTPIVANPEPMQETSTLFIDGIPIEAIINNDIGGSGTIIEVPVQYVKMLTDKSLELNIRNIKGEQLKAIWHLNDSVQATVRENKLEITMQNLTDSQEMSIGKLIIWTTNPVGQLLSKDYTAIEAPAVNKTDSYTSIEARDITIEKNDLKYEIQIFQRPIKEIDRKQLLNATTKDWLLVNPTNPVPKGYAPKGLVWLKGGNNIAIRDIGVNVLPNVESALYKMMQKAKADKYTKFTAISGYRGIEKQTSLFNAKYQELKKSLKSHEKAYNETKRRIAVPTTSEHHTGLAIDILCTSSPKTETFWKTKEAKWLGKNCWDYGFIIRYPANKTKETQIMYEGWHLRYLGLPYSYIMRDNDWCYEEFVAYVEAGNIISYQYEGKTHLIGYLSDIQKIGYTMDKPIEYKVSEITTNGYIATIIIE
jgi:LAS superfamily LD-carboxypeptidase LdcB